LRPKTFTQPLPQRSEFSEASPAVTIATLPPLSSISCIVPLPASNLSSLLTLYLLNPTSLAKPNAVQLLGADLHSNDVDICMICETWFTPKHCDELVSIEDFYILRKDRSKRKGGGVCFYVRKTIHASVHIFGSMHQDIELIWINVNVCDVSYFIACCYYPPKPVYKPQMLVDVICRDIECINDMTTSSVIFVAGDFNNFNTEFLETDCGLEQIVVSPTHGNNIIDKVFCSRPDVFNSIVTKSLIKTKHYAVLVNNKGCGESVKTNVRRKVKVYDLSNINIDRLRCSIGSCDWSDIFDCVDVNLMYSTFLERLQSMIASDIPSRSVSMGPRDPAFITPKIKSLLKKRYKLRRSGKSDQANALAEKINKLIVCKRNSLLLDKDNCSIKELWEAVNPQSKLKASVTDQFGAEAANTFFAKISSEDYRPNEDNTKIAPDFISTCFPLVSDTADIMPVNTNSCDVLTPWFVEGLLSSVKHTAPGFDEIPFWVFKQCSFELAEIITYVFKLSLTSGIVPVEWHYAIVTPIPKIPKPTSLADYRPISVTPILSRMLEKIIVNQLIRPALPKDLLIDQFAFKPTGSTTSALTYFMHRVTAMLETSSYVRCLLIDFSKAFDVINHDILIAKLKSLNLEPNVFKWVTSFLSNRYQATKANGEISSFRPISKGVVQGSAIGPLLFTIMASDLKALSPKNDLWKYADDTTLLTPELTDVQLETEFAHVQGWALLNKMVINLAKTKEIVMHRPNPRNFINPPPLADILQTSSVILLGVHFSHSFKFDEHVKALLSQCSQRMYLLRSLRNQGLPLAKLDIIHQAVIINKIRYALPVWGGFLSAAQVGQINALLKRTFRFGYSKIVHSLESILEKSDRAFFHSICDSNHCINHILPPIKLIQANLRPRGIPFQLPDHYTTLQRKAFVIRSLFNFM
jgi:Reverse transcriptase (RNA-dependent DNA polymerase)